MLTYPYTLRGVSLEVQFRLRVINDYCYRQDSGVKPCRIVIYLLPKQSVPRSSFFTRILCKLTISNVRFS